MKNQYKSNTAWTGPKLGLGLLLLAGVWVSNSFGFDFETQTVAGFDVSCEKVADFEKLCNSYNAKLKLVEKPVGIGCSCVNAEGSGRTVYWNDKDTDCEDLVNAVIELKGCVNGDLNPKTSVVAE